MRYLLNFLTACSIGLAAVAEARDFLSRFQNPKVSPETGFYGQPEFQNAPMLEKRASPFLNPKSQKFVVNGTSLPDIPFDVGESYAGLLPISNNKNETRQLFFWFFPTTNPAAKNEITVWLQGGPGASSMLGLFYENGPIQWQPGTGFTPVRNAYSWTNLTNVVWIDQPVGVGFSQGKPNITNEYQLADQFSGFWKNFINTFNMQGYKIYLTGESYGGYYLPYIGNNFLDQNDTQNFNLKGMSIINPVIGDTIIQFEGVVMQYYNYWSHVFNLNSTFISQITAANQKCGYADYLDKYFRFPPPPGPFPYLFGKDYAADLPVGCDVQTAFFNAIYEVNPCFDYNHIYSTCPFQFSILGPFVSSYNPPGPAVYFTRPDVQKALNAPVGTNWMLGVGPVFVGKPTPYAIGQGDNSLPPANIGIVSKIIERTNNVFIGVGSLDFQLPANGTLFVFQNMTWNGRQGFQQFPGNTLYAPYHPDYSDGSLAGAGAMGQWGTERGLTFWTSALAGHEVPWYTPGVAYRALEVFLGRVANLGVVGDFTTQTGNYTGTSSLP